MLRPIICQLLAVAGAPYDTLEEVIGIRDSNGLGSLKDFRIDYREVPVCCHLLFSSCLHVETSVSHKCLFTESYYLYFSLLRMEGLTGLP